MARGPNIARVASLIGDNARAEVLSALMTGCSCTATELADAAGVTRQTISSHLGKLLDAGLVEVDQQGRHRYFRLAGGEVADLLESLMGLAARSAPSRPLFFGPREPALRKARVCYDHLAGELGVLMYEEMIRHGLLERLDGAPRLTEQGGTWLTRIGIDVRHAAGRKRSFCRACLDWSERRHHLAGWLGAALLKHILDMGWAQREQESRAITFSTDGEQSLRALFQWSGARDPSAVELQVAAWPKEK
jgi:DNA-binding transcriptional ArsR family regulator